MDIKDNRLDKKVLIESLDIINKKLDEGISQLNLLLNRMGKAND